MLRKLVAYLSLVAICTALAGCAGVSWGGSGSSARAMQNQALVRESLDRLIAAYEGKNSRLFAELVSERYTGEKGILDSAVRRDFSVYHNQSLRYTVNNITFDGSGGKAFVAITLTRDWTEIKTGKTRHETTEESLVFVLEDGVYKLYSQRRPPLFGRN